MWKWLILALVGLILAYLVSRVSRFVGLYRRLFAVEHYQEVAVDLERLRHEASKNPWVEVTGPVEPLTPDDPRVAVTSQSLAVVYTMSPPEDGSRHHHVSVSTPDAGHTTHAAGQNFVSFVVWRMGLRPEDCLSFFGPSSYHLEFMVPEERHSDFMERSLSLPEPTDLQSIRDEIARIRDHIEFVDVTRPVDQAGGEEN